MVAYPIVRCRMTGRRMRSTREVPGNRSDQAASGTGVTWTSMRPFGPGTMRMVSTPLGMLALNEVYFRWEEGQRKWFYVAEATAPLFRTFAEDYLVEGVSPSRCRFTWTVAFEAPPAARPGNPINRLIRRSLSATPGATSGSDKPRLQSEPPSRLEQPTRSFAVRDVGAPVAIVSWTVRNGWRPAPALTIRAS